MTASGTELFYFGSDARPTYWPTKRLADEHLQKLLRNPPEALRKAFNGEELDIAVFPDPERRGFTIGDGRQWGCGYWNVEHNCWIHDNWIEKAPVTTAQERRERCGCPQCKKAPEILARLAKWKEDQAWWAEPDDVQPPHLWATQDGQNCLACAQAAYRVVVAMAEAEADLAIAERDGAEDWERMKDQMLGILCYWRTQVRQLDAQVFGGRIDDAAREKRELFPDSPPYVDRIPEGGVDDEVPI
jgi:hypothetical protein